MIGMMRLMVDLILTYHGVSVGGMLEEWNIGEVTALFVMFSIGLFLMELGGRGSATFDEMQTDVMDALAWFDSNRHKLVKNHERGAKTNNQIVFGGYSSGGHVAATVMQQPHLWKERNLPDPKVYCSTVLYVSPVLSTKPYHVELERHLSSLSLNKLPSTLLSSLDESHTSSRMPDLDSGSISSQSTSLQERKLQPPPLWLTNELVRAVFGPNAQNIPSPIYTYNQSPAIPHIFIGCKNEMFGLKWLDLFFSSEDYCDLLKSMGIESRYISVDSDHWNILGSRGLAKVLEVELGRVGKLD